jgi:hypothetical protein
MPSGLLQRCRPDLTSQVRVIGQTADTPTPPLVGSLDGSLDSLGALSSAFLEAHRNASMLAVMDKLLLRRFARPDPLILRGAARALRGRGAIWGLASAGRGHPPRVRAVRYGAPVY